MENTGKKVAAVIFMILALIAFVLGTVFGAPILAEPGGTSEEQAGQAIAVILLILPFLVCYAAYFIFNLIEFFLSISLIRNDCKGLGVFNLLLSLGTFGGALYMVLKILVLK